MSDRKQLIQEGSPFNAIRREDDEGNEYWSARELAKALGYTQWRNFKTVIEKAKMACEKSGNVVANHFAGVSKMVEVGSGSKRETEDVRLSRYACYLVVENADPSKPVVALGQTYLATKARQAELLEKEPHTANYSLLTDQNRFLQGVTAKVAGIVRARDFSIFQDHGYQGLYNGETAQDIHRRKGLKKSQEITDYMGRAELAANWFRASQTEAALVAKGITDPDEANSIHYLAGKETRESMGRISGIMPEDLPAPTDSIQKVKRKHLKPGTDAPEFGEPKEEE